MPMTLKFSIRTSFRFFRIPWMLFDVFGPGRLQNSWAILYVRLRVYIRLYVVMDGMLWFGRYLNANTSVRAFWWQVVRTVFHRMVAAVIEYNVKIKYTHCMEKKMKNETIEFEVFTLYEIWRPRRLKNTHQIDYTNTFRIYGCYVGMKEDEMTTRVKVQTWYFV